MATTVPAVIEQRGLTTFVYDDPDGNFVHGVSAYPILRTAFAGSKYQIRVGDVFGRFRVVGYDPRAKDMSYFCLCSCGTIKTVHGRHLFTGGTVSCGCYQRDDITLRSLKHGAFGTPEYKAWGSMISRCEDSSRDDFDAYGGRGITVCREWRESFSAFYAYVGKRPSSHHSIDRIDVNGNYQPGNVRWATVEVQANNKRNTHLLTVGELTMSVSQWSRRVGLDRKTIIKLHSKGLLNVN